MTQPPEYYIWVLAPNEASRHGLKPVTKERGEKLIAKYNKKYPMNHYWLEQVELPAAEPKKEEN